MRLPEEILDFSEAALFRRILAEIEETMEDFDPVRCAYQAELARLRAVGLPVDILEKAVEARLSADVLFAFHRGFEANRKHFREPEYDFIASDPERYLNERLMGNMPGHIQAARVFDSVMDQVSDEDSAAIYDYLSYLECTAPRLAHYYGFLLGDRLWYYMEPGYLPDRAYSMRYRRILEEMLDIKP